MRLEVLTEEKTDQFKADMKAAFRFGAMQGMDLDEEVLPEEDLVRSLSAEGAVAYTAMEGEEMVGGAIVVIDAITQINHLDFLYVKVGQQGKKIGQFIWREIENRYPDTEIWETCTPYFDKRNIHFYINRCGFHAVEFYNRFHPDSHFPEDAEDDQFDGMFRFQNEEVCVQEKNYMKSFL